MRATLENKRNFDVGAKVGLTTEKLRQLPEVAELERLTEKVAPTDLNF